MSVLRLQGKRILVTHADAFIGPVLCEVLAEHGATVIANSATLLRTNRQLS
jgi:2-keto-3-deoxy-L-fuconate dehydrogenase